MRSAWLGFAFLLSLPLATGAQNLPITALPFLEIPPSPSINAMGGTGVALPSSDPHAFLYNPAQLGLAARDIQAAGTLYPEGSSDWLSVGDLSVGSAALTAGVDLRTAGLPLVAGIGFGQVALEFSERLLLDGDGRVAATYTPRDRYHALSLGLATTGAARVSVGATTRYVTSTDRARMEGGQLSISALRGFTFDVGAMAEADVTRLMGSPEIGPIRPELSIAAGYAQTSIGGTVAYSGQYAPTALPRTARLGWSATGGLSVPVKATHLQLMQAEVSVQAEHLLVRENQDRTFSYASLIGDLDVIDNAVMGHGSADVTARKGLRMTFLETLAISRGGFDGWGYEDVRTSGLEFRLAGPLKMIGAWTGNQDVSNLAERYDVRLTRSTYFQDDLNESTFTGLSFIVKR